MDNNGNSNAHTRPLQTLTKAHSSTTDRRTPTSNRDVLTDDEDDKAESSQVWCSFKQSFRQVQSVLDRNRLLIHQVNENHQSKSHENMVRNVELIQEINGNISKVVSLYSDLSANFSGVFHQQHPPNGNNAKPDN